MVLSKTRAVLELGRTWDGGISRQAAGRGTCTPEVSHGRAKLTGVGSTQSNSEEEPEACHGHHTEAAGMEWQSEGVVTLGPALTPLLASLLARGCAEDPTPLSTSWKIRFLR